MLKDKYLEIFLIIISLVCFLVMGYSMYRREVFFSIYKYTREDGLYVSVDSIDSYRTLKTNIPQDLKTNYYVVISNHEERVYYVYYDGVDIEYYGVPLIGLQGFAGVSYYNNEYHVSVPLAATHDESPFSKNYLNYSYELIAIDQTNIDSIREIRGIAVFETKDFDESMLRDIAYELEMWGLGLPYYGSNIIQSFNQGILLFTITLQILSVVPIIFCFIISFIFYKINNHKYETSMIIRRILGISNFRLLLISILFFFQRFIIPMVIGIILASLYYYTLGITIVDSVGLIVYSILFSIILLTTSIKESRNISKKSLIRLET